MRFLENMSNAKTGTDMWLENVQMEETLENFLNVKNGRYTLFDREFRFDADICLQVEQLLNCYEMNTKEKPKKKLVRPRDAVSRIPIKKTDKKRAKGIFAIIEGLANIYT